MDKGYSTFAKADSHQINGALVQNLWHSDEQFVSWKHELRANLPVPLLSTLLPPTPVNYMAANYATPQELVTYAAVVCPVTSVAFSLPVLYSHSLSPLSPTPRSGSSAQQTPSLPSSLLKLLPMQAVLALASSIARISLHRDRSLDFTVSVAMPDDSEGWARDPLLFAARDFFVAASLLYPLSLSDLFRRTSSPSFLSFPPSHHYPITYSSPSTDHLPAVARGTSAPLPGSLYVGIAPATPICTNVPIHRTDIHVDSAAVASQIRSLLFDKSARDLLRPEIYLEFVTAESLPVAMQRSDLGAFASVFVSRAQHDDGLVADIRAALFTAPETRTHAEVRTIICSNYTSSSLSAAFTRLGLSPSSVLSKPCAFEYLLWPHLDLVHALSSRPYFNAPGLYLASDVSAVFRSAVISCETALVTWDAELGVSTLSDYGSSWIARLCHHRGVLNVLHDPMVELDSARLLDVAVRIYPTFALAVEETIQVTLGSALNAPGLLALTQSDVASRILAAALTVSVCSTSDSISQPTFSFTWHPLPQAGPLVPQPDLVSVSRQTIPAGMTTVITVHRSGLWPFVQPYISELSGSTISDASTLPAHKSGTLSATGDLAHTATLMRIATQQGARVFGEHRTSHHLVSYVELTVTTNQMYGIHGPADQLTAPFKAPLSLISCLCKELRTDRAYQSFTAAGVKLLARDFASSPAMSSPSTYECALGGM